MFLLDAATLAPGGAGVVRAGARGALYALDHFGRLIFFLDLFVDKPVHEDLRGIILRFARRFIGGVDALRVGTFLRPGLLRDSQQSLEILLGRRQRGLLRRLSPIRQVFEDALGVGALPAGLLDGVFGETLEIPGVASHRQGQIAMGGSQFLIELPVELLDYLVVDFGFGHDGGKFNTRPPGQPTLLGNLPTINGRPPTAGAGRSVLSCAELLRSFLIECDV